MSSDFWAGYILGGIIGWAMYDQRLHRAIRRLWK